MVVSPMQNAAQASIGAANDWHTVGVLRQGQTAWVYDPAYSAGAYTRLPMIPGTSNVTRLFNSTGFGNITLVQVQGIGSPQLDCMGRSAQWVDNVIRAPHALAPYAPQTFVPGQPTPGWDIVQRF